MSAIGSPTDGLDRLLAGANGVTPEAMAAFESVQGCDDLLNATTIAIHDALAALDPDHRELLTLTAWEGLTPTEIAAMTGQTPGAIRVQLHRARRQLRRQLARLGIESAGEPVALVALDSRVP